MTIGRKVNKPRIARFGATNIHPMRGTPSARWRTRIGTSTAFNSALAIDPDNASTEWRCGSTVDCRGAHAPLFRGGLGLLVDVRADAFERIVERHLADDRLPEPSRGRVEDGAVELVALDLVRDR